jgi:hypothetical protein
VTVDCGTSGTDVPTDWYFPQPDPNLGLVWLQHGFSRANNQMVDLATEIASRGYVVFATSLAPGTTGCAMNNAGFLSDFARLFPDLADPNTGLLRSARAAALAAGVPLSTLPADFAFSGHSAGDAAVLAVARNLVVDHPAAAAGLRGIALPDPVESTTGALIATALPALATLPVYTVSSPAYSCNSNTSGTVLLAASGRPFAGVRLATGCHCDAEGDSTDFLCTAFCGTPQPANVAALQTPVTGWLVDFFADDFGGGQDFLARPKSSLVLTRVLADVAPGNDGLVLRADFRLGAGASFAALDPSLEGARIVVANAAGTPRLDASLPGGSYAGRGTRGWLRTSTR